jgi:hypothetical protein
MPLGEVSTNSDFARALMAEAPNSPELEALIAKTQNEIGALISKPKMVRRAAPCLRAADTPRRRF